MEEILDKIAPLNALKDTRERGKWIKIAFIGMAVISVVSGISSYLQLEMLQTANEGFIYTDEEANQNDIREQFIGGIVFALNLTTIILFLKWFRRSYGNLHRIDPKPLEFSEKFAIWAWFIPILNLFQPYKIAKEIVTETQKHLRWHDPEYQPTGTTNILGFWWALFIISGLLDRVEARLILKAETMQEYITYTELSLVVSVVTVLAALVSFSMVNLVAKDVDQLYLKYDPSTLLTNKSEAENPTQKDENSL